jgi:hypothetical protein
MKDRPVSDDEAFDARADWTVRFEEAQKAIETTSWGKGMAKFDRAMRRAAGDARRARRGALMTDAEIRGRLLEHFNNLQHNNGGWVPISDIILAPEPVELRVIGGVCQQLADIGLIHWKPLRGADGIVAGMAKITGKGVAAFEFGRSSEIDIRFPSKNVTAPSAPSATDDQPISDAALAEIRDAVSTIKAELPALTLSNSEKADIIADIKQIEIETERPTPRRPFMKLYMESLRDNLAKAAGAATAGGLVTLAALVGGLIAKHFGVF